MSRTAFTEIPLVDVAPFLAGGAAEKRAVAAEVRRICAEVGFFYLVGHGVPEAVVAEARVQAGRFFALPPEEKLKLHIDRLPNHRGYLGSGEENADPSQPGDLKEVFKLGREATAEDPDFRLGRRMFGPNAWPEGLPGFRGGVVAYYEALFALSQRLYGLFALALELPEDWFAPLVTRPIAQLNLIHYPAQRPDDPAVPGIGAHSDYECFTLLWQDEVGGLEVRNQAGVFVPAPPVPGSFVVNIGDMMARWTNDRFASTVHRVVNRSGRERYSIAFFAGTNYDTRVECLETCRSPERPPRYPPCIAGDYQMERLFATNDYLKAQAAQGAGA